MKNIYFVLCLIGFPHLTEAQTKKEDKIQVHKQVQNYYKGYLENDSVAIYVAFEIAQGHMKALQKDSISGKDFVRVYAMEQVAKRWIHKKPFSGEQKKVSHLKILSTDILKRQLAIVKVELKAGEKIYYDYLSLYKIEGVWKIVNKVFVEK